MQEGVDNNSNATVWYNYAGATAGTIIDMSNYFTATYDICPKNWRLPTDSEQSGIRSYTTAFSPVYGGFYNDGSLYDAATRGYWWSATAESFTFRYGLCYGGGILSTDDYYRIRGLYVRCVRTT